MRCGQKILIGVGGNIGAGKTAAAKIFSEFGGKYISADEVGWDVLPEIADLLERKFGKSIMSRNKIDKRILRELVFADTRKLQFLNHVSHPVLTKRIKEITRGIKKGFVVIDAALLFDWPDIYEMIDYSILVIARREVMLSRARMKGIGDDLFKRILSMQKSEEEMMAMASYVIENNGTMIDLREKCQKIYNEIRNDC